MCIIIWNYNKAHLILSSLIIYNYKPKVFATE